MNPSPKEVAHYVIPFTHEFPHIGNINSRKASQEEINSENINIRSI